MILNIIISTADKVLNVSFRWLDQNLVSNFLIFVRVFEFDILVMDTIFFLLVSVHIMIRQYKRLPKS
ncbi:MAG: hypothetical protein ACJ71R_00290, partial [Nitrososphaeraceae archaeon]